MWMVQASAPTSRSVSWERIPVPRIREGYVVDIIDVSIVVKHHGVKVLYDDRNWEVDLARCNRMLVEGLWHLAVVTCVVVKFGDAR